MVGTSCAARLHGISQMAMSAVYVCHTQFGDGLMSAKFGVRARHKTASVTSGHRGASTSAGLTSAWQCCTMRRPSGSVPKLLPFEASCAAICLNSASSCERLCDAYAQAAEQQTALEARLAAATEELGAVRAEAADMKGIMADTARILDQKNAEARTPRLWNHQN